MIGRYPLVPGIMLVQSLGFGMRCVVFKKKAPKIKKRAQRHHSTSLPRQVSAWGSGGADRPVPITLAGVHVYVGGMRLALVSPDRRHTAAARDPGCLLRFRFVYVRISTTAFCCSALLYRVCTCWRNKRRKKRVWLLSHLERHRLPRRALRRRPIGRFPAQD